MSYIIAATGERVKVDYDIGTALRNWHISLTHRIDGKNYPRLSLNNGTGHMTLLARWIMKCTSEESVFYKNHNPLDCRRKNLIVRPYNKAKPHKNKPYKRNKYNIPFYTPKVVLSKKHIDKKLQALIYGKP